MRTRLSQEQIDRAYRMFYGDGMNLAQIMEALGCGLYDLSPWLTRAAINIAREADENRAANHQRRFEENEALRAENARLRMETYSTRRHTRIRALTEQVAELKHKLELCTSTLDEKNV